MSGTNDNVLISVSIELLYVGMTVQDDIYDSNGDRLLVTSGTTLSLLHLERLRNLNNGRLDIFVTRRTHKAMLTKKGNIKAESISEVEAAAGYVDTKEETFKLLEEIASDKTVKPESLSAVSDELTEKLESTPPAVVISLINAMAPVDEYLQRHSVNVGLLNGLIGRWMGMSDAEVNRLVLIGLLHDCGKVLIPPKILNVPRRLTVVEYEIIKKHVRHTYDLLSEFPEHIRLASCCHHERIDGSGYTKGLSNKEIMSEARITAVSDTYDAIVSRRIYQEPQSPFTTLALLKKLSVNELDKEIVDVFIKHIPEDLVGKAVSMSDGTIGVIRHFDANDIEFPTIEVAGRTFKSNKNLYAISMYNED
ncbi:MAG: HD domain-containing protein [Oscillospiraceae bacterium]|nr:HD domain-containing protein [Oscillospiraceae bacterium]